MCVCIYIYICIYLYAFTYSYTYIFLETFLLVIPCTFHAIEYTVKDLFLLFEVTAREHVGTQGTQGT